MAYITSDTVQCPFSRVHRAHMYAYTYVCTYVIDFATKRLRGAARIVKFADPELRPAVPEAMNSKVTSVIQTGECGISSVPLYNVFREETKRFYTVHRVSYETRSVEIFLLAVGCWKISLSSMAWLNESLRMIVVNCQPFYSKVPWAFLFSFLYGRFLIIMLTF